MGKYLSQNNFVGEYKLPSDAYSEEDLSSYIDRYERRLLIQLFGAELFKAFEADFDTAPAGEPVEDRFIAVWNEILIDENDCSLLHSEGIPIMLTCLIYFYYLRDLNFQSTIGGTQRNSQADAVEAQFNQTNINTIYNRGVEYWNIIQYYMDCYNPENYDYISFNGRIKNFNSLI